MYQVGSAMPTAFRETAEGGLAATPKGKALAKEIFGWESVNVHKLRIQNYKSKTSTIKMFAFILRSSIKWYSSVNNNVQK